MKTLLCAAAVATLAATSAQAVTVSSVTTSGTSFGAPGLVIDGDFGLGSWFTDAPNVYWFNQTGAAGVTITLSFDAAYTLNDVRLGVDNNDFYVVQVSKDNLTWNTLFVSLPTSLDPGYSYNGQSMIKKSSVLGDTGYSSLIDFAPVQASYARIYALSGDGSYAVSELQFVGAPVPEPGAGALMLAGLAAGGLLLARRRG